MASSSSRIFLSREWVASLSDAFDFACVGGIIELACLVWAYVKKGSPSESMVPVSGECESARLAVPCRKFKAREIDIIICLKRKNGPCKCKYFGHFQPSASIATTICAKKTLIFIFALSHMNTNRTSQTYPLQPEHSRSPNSITPSPLFLYRWDIQLWGQISTAMNPPIYLQKNQVDQKEQFHALYHADPFALLVRTHSTLRHDS